MKEIAARYGVAILRADVKDLTFPGDLQQIMNRVLAAERMSEAQLVEARTKAEVEGIEAPDPCRRGSAWLLRPVLKGSAWPPRPKRRRSALRPSPKSATCSEREQSAQAFSDHPALLRLLELEALRDLAKTANARIYVNFDNPNKPEPNSNRSERLET